MQNSSKIVNIFRTSPRLLKIKNLLQHVRKDSNKQGPDHDPHGGWRYREPPTPPRWAYYQSIGCASLVYWWFYWNMYHGWEHVIGRYYGSFLPNPRDWTDEELGIPPE